MTALALPAYAQLSDADEAALTDLYRRGTPPNTLRAWERDLAYIAAWKMATFGRPLAWPEDEKVALRFILDHAQDLTVRPGPAQDTAMELQALGLRVALTCPAPPRSTAASPAGRPFTACATWPRRLPPPWSNRPARRPDAPMQGRASLNRPNPSRVMFLRPYLPPVTPPIAASATVQC
jgi:hypothetical protein